MPQKSRESVRVCACASQCVCARVYGVYTCFCVCASMFCVCVHLCPLCLCVWGAGVGVGGGGAWRFNTRCLKAVGLTACHKTAWLIESPGMSSTAVLMNPKPKGLMKRAPFAKTVPRLDLP